MTDSNLRPTEPGLVSIIIPAYKHEQYVRQAISSAIAQTYQNAELIIVDDGSPDDTWKVIQSLEEECRRRFRRVEFSRQENKGICETLNVLLSQVQGEYFMRLDSDDLIKPHSVEKLQAFLAGHREYGLAVGDNEIVDENGQTVYWDQKANNTVDPKEAVFKTFGDRLKNANKGINFNSDDFGTYESLLWANYIPNGYLVRSELMRNVSFTSLAPREDYFMMLQIAKQAKFKFLDEILHSYRWHAYNNIKKIDEDVRFVIMTKKHEIDLLKNSGEIEKYRPIINNIIKRKKKVKGKIGNWFEYYKVMDIYGENKLYALRLGSRTFSLMGMHRGVGERAGRWRPCKARSIESFYV